MNNLEPTPHSGSALLGVAAGLGFLAVAIGAFGAHGLDGRLDAEQLDWYQTGAYYQLVHAVMAVVCVALSARFGARCTTAGWLMSAGAVVFASTLYALAFGAPRILGAVTPIGGVLMLCGWAQLAWAALRFGRP